MEVRSGWKRKEGVKYKAVLFSGWNNKTNKMTKLLQAVIGATFVTYKFIG